MRRTTVGVVHRRTLAGCDNALSIAWQVIPTTWRGSLAYGMALPPDVAAPESGFIGEWKERTSLMNRFFSKLNLQDIKINPEGNRFPPDADEHEETDAPVIEHRHEAVAVVDEPVVPVEEAVDEGTFEASHDGQVATYAVEETVEVVPSEPVATNGHNGQSHEAVAETVAVYGGDAMVGVEGEVLKVSARSRPSAVAGAIAGVVREAGRAEVQAIGAGATNQAIKAVAIARDYLGETGIDAICIPAFIDVTIDNEDRTAIRLVVEPR